MEHSITIVIVSYNVRQFIIKCLESIYSSIPDKIIGKIVVVDNASIDGSVIEIGKLFPNVEIISNKENIGFGAANNIALRQVSTKYTLILNPDTLLENDTLQKCVSFIENHKDVAMLGVKMIDGNGSFLQESKRGLPSIMSSFYKLSGVINLFPTSKSIAAYYMGHINQEVTAEIEVVTGAFMFAKTQVLKEVDFFDERFFMYGEDIDLSKKVLDAGHKIYYLPTTKIVHFKGESTKKGDINYSIRFYSAIGKYYSKYNQGLSKYLVAIAVFFMGILGFVKQILGQSVRMFIHIFIILLSFELVRYLWANYYYEIPDYYDYSIFLSNVLMYIILITSCNWLFGLYDKNPKSKNYWIGFSTALVSILIFYSLLPEPYRSSRAMIFLGLGMTFVLIHLFDKLWEKFVVKSDKVNKTIIVGSKESAIDLESSLLKKNDKIEIMGVLSPKEDNDPYYLNNVANLNKVVKELSIDNIVFSNRDMSTNDIFGLMILPDQKINYLIASHNNDFVLGSSDKSKQGSILEVKSTYNLAKPVYRRMKRILDISGSIVCIVLFPIVKFVYKRTKFGDYIEVLMNKKTLVSYSGNYLDKLPNLKIGIFDTSMISKEMYPKLILENGDQNKYYAKVYTPLLDLQLLAKNT